MHKFKMAASRVKMDASLRYFIDLVTLNAATHLTFSKLSSDKVDINYIATSTSLTVYCSFFKTEDDKSIFLFGTYNCDTII